MFRKPANSPGWMVSGHHSSQKRCVFVLIWWRCVQNPCHRRPLYEPISGAFATFVTRFAGMRSSNPTV